MIEETQHPPIVLNPPMNVILIESVDQLPELVAWLKAHNEFGWDIETTCHRDFYHRRCRTMQFGNRDTQFLIDLLAIVGGDTAILRDTQGHYGKHLDPRLRKVIEAIGPFLTSRYFLKVGFNLGFEYMTHYWCFGLRTQGFFDCMMVEKAIWAGAHSLKDYGFFSMADTTGRYFHRAVEKELQSSFNLTEPLTDAQIFYACLDVRIPLLLKNAQERIIHGDPKYTIPLWINVPSFVCGDNLERICQLENDAIGAFQDMGVHGDCIDIPRWTKKIEKRKQDLVVSLAEMDAMFIEYVGKKGGAAYSEKQVADAEATWKVIKLPKAIASHIDETNKKVMEYASPADEAIVLERERLKKDHGDMKKANTARKKKSEDCQGEAFINYNSPIQLKDVLLQVPGLEKLRSTDADTLERMEHIPICKVLSTYRKIAKEISTYGMTWVQEWINEVPNNKENDEIGWINPHDHRLHPQYNQYDAETGRSSSSGPNGQNLPHDKETRACFIAGPPDEDIIGLWNSKCCGKRANSAIAVAHDTWQCSKCGAMCFGKDSVEPESYVLLTIDMSGAELRILAEAANEKIWIDAFNKGQDVHSICCELVDAEKWKSLTAKPNDMMKNKKGDMVPVPPCAFYALGADSLPQKFKCECPKHNEYRNDFKPVNFGIAYGMGPRALSGQIHKEEAICKELLKAHRAALPVLWMHIDESGKNAVDRLRSFDLFGRRELFREPTYEDAIKYAEDPKHRNEDGEKPLIKYAMKALYGNIERAGKNMPIQSGNASIIKLAMGCGYDKDKKPFLWHLLPKYDARLIKMVHDELVIRCLKSNADEVAIITADAIRRAGAERLKKLVMESEHHIEYVWTK